MKIPSFLISVLLGVLFGFWMLIWVGLSLQISTVLGFTIGWIVAWIERGFVGGEEIHSIYDFSKSEGKRPMSEVGYYNLREDDEMEARHFKRFDTPDPGYL